jgi:hypothetical protein
MDNISSEKQEAKKARIEWALQIDSIVERIYDDGPEAEPEAAEAIRREIRKIRAAAAEAEELLASAQDWANDLRNGIQPDLDD